MIDPVRLRWVFRGRPKVASTSLALVSGWLRRSQLHPQDVDLGRIVIIPLDRHLVPNPATVLSALEELFLNSAAAVFVAQEDLAFRHRERVE